MPARYCLLLIVLCLAAGCGQDETQPVVDVQSANAPPAEVKPVGPVVVYATSGLGQLVDVLDAYRAETGSQYEILAEEEARSPNLLDTPRQLPKTDLFIASSLAELWSVAEDDGLRPTYSDAITGNIRDSLRDPESRWSALSARVRLVVYNAALVSSEEIDAVQDYASLGNAVWQNRLCVSSSRVAGNRSLVAFLIRQHGVSEAEAIVRRWRANFGDSVYQSDADLLEAFAADRCAIGIVDNSILQNVTGGSSQTGLTAHWFENGGELLIDVRGAGVSRHAANPDAAVKLLEWLTTRDGNALFAIRQTEFPANAASPIATALESRAENIRNTDSLSSIGFLQEDALKLIERARYR
ncbi:MAG: extracellular solute-binding protein [Woeseiaceae bacterium]